MNTLALLVLPNSEDVLDEDAESFEVGCYLLVLADSSTVHCLANHEAAHLDPVVDLGCFDGSAVMAKLDCAVFVEAGEVELAVACAPLTHVEHLAE